jgi:hypothetical protein
MRRVPTFVLVCAGLLVTRGAKPAQVPDIIITVPVKLSKIYQAVTMGKVTCLTHSAANELLGEGDQAFPIPSSGEFTGQIAVKVYVDPSIIGKVSTTYTCRLRLQVGSTWYDPGPNADPVAKPKIGTTFTSPVSGPIP